MNNIVNFSVKNFGPLKKADIGISPLTLFVGPNSSGKSFLSLLIHSLLNPFAEFNSNRFPMWAFQHMLEENKQLFEEFNNNLNEFVESKPLFEDSFKFDLEKFNKLISTGFGVCYSRIIEKTIKNNWKTNLNDLNSKKKNPFEISYKNTTFINDSNQLCLKSSIDVSKLISGFSIVDDFNFEVLKVSFDDNYLTVNLNFEAFNKMFNNVFLSQIIYVSLCDKLIDKLKYNSTYINLNGDVFKDLN